VSTLQIASRRWAPPPPVMPSRDQVSRSLRAFFDALEIAGLEALTLDKHRPAPSWSTTGGNPLAPPYLEGMLHAKYRYFLAHIRDDKTIYTVPELRRLLGIVTRDGYHPQTETGKERERLMVAAGWPTETLTLEELRAR
jgi:hypothetical protein